MTVSPNVLLILCDDLNNALPRMGRTPHAIAPNIERLMQRSVAFRNHQNNCPLCLPSRNSMLSGLYPATTGQMTLWDHTPECRPIPTTQPVDRAAQRPWLRDAVMLPQYFKANGYRTYGAGKVFHGWYRADANWSEHRHIIDYGPCLWDAVRDWQRAHPDRLPLYEGQPLLDYIARYEGVDRFFLNGNEFRHHIELSFGSTAEIFTGQPDIRQGDHKTPFRYVNDDDRDRLPDENTANWVLDTLRKHSGNEPFFMAVGFIKPHSPLNAPQRFFDLYPTDKLELPPFLENDTDDCARALIEHRPFGFLIHRMLTENGEALWRKWIQSYLACVSFVDEQIGRILDDIEAGPYADNTIVLLAGDNGYHMGEKGYIYKDSLWEASDQVPLIVSAPGQAATNRFCETPVSLIDLYPTLIDLCGLPDNPHRSTHGHPLEGHSLRPLLENPEKGEWNGPPVALTTVRGDTGIHHSVRSERYRYTLCQNGEEELYDHETDPHEWRNLAGDPRMREVKAGLRRELGKLMN